MDRLWKLHFSSLHETVLINWLIWKPFLFFGYCVHNWFGNSLHFFDIVSNWFRNRFHFLDNISKLFGNRIHFFLETVSRCPKKWKTKLLLWNHLSFPTSIHSGLVTIRNTLWSIFRWMLPRTFNNIIYKYNWKVTS